MNTQQLAQRVTAVAMRARRHGARSLFVMWMLGVGHVAAQTVPDEYRLVLDKIPFGQSPAGWVAAATNSSGPLAQWSVAAGELSPGRARKILTIARIQDASPGVFNLYWTRQAMFQDGELEVRMRANTGREDQGGGLIWRAIDENNYYVARYNPLENNFRLYCVKAGSRTTLASRERLASAPGQWVTLRIAHHGQRIQGWFNNALAWEISDAQFPKSGGVGLWSKADAASSFADFRVSSGSLKDREPLRNE